MGGVGYHIALMRSKAAAGATQLYYRTVLALPSAVENFNTKLPTDGAADGPVGPML